MLEMQAEHKAKERERLQHEEMRKAAALKRKEERRQKEDLEKAKAEEEHRKKRERYLKAVKAVKEQGVVSTEVCLLLHLACYAYSCA